MIDKFDYSLPEKIEDFDRFSLIAGSILGILVTSLFFGTLTMYDGFNYLDNGNELADQISPEEAGMETETFVNERILKPSPNNVSAEYVSVVSAENDGLPEFYKIEMNVSNPSGSQVTEVFTRKDGSLVFLQFPRKLSPEEFDSDKYH